MDPSLPTDGESSTSLTSPAPLSPLPATSPRLLQRTAPRSPHTHQPVQPVSTPAVVTVVPQASSQPLPPSPTSVPSVSNPGLAAILAAEEARLPPAPSSPRAPLSPIVDRDALRDIVPVDAPADTRADPLFHPLPPSVTAEEEFSAPPVILQPPQLQPATISNTPVTVTPLQPSRSGVTPKRAPHSTPALTPLVGPAAAGPGGPGRRVEPQIPPVAASVPPAVPAVVAPPVLPPLVPHAATTPTAPIAPNVPAVAPITPALTLQPPVPILPPAPLTVVPEPPNELEAQLLKEPGTTLHGDALEVNARCVLVVGDLLWIAVKAGAIHICRRTGELVHIIEGKTGAHVACLLHVGNNVWAGSSDGVIRVLAVQSFKLVTECREPLEGTAPLGVLALAYNAHAGRVYAAGTGAHVSVWDAVTFHRIGVLRGHEGRSYAVIYDPLHGSVYTGGSDSGIVEWDATSGARLQLLSGHAAGVCTLALTAKFLWSGSDDGSVRVWDRNTGQPVKAFDLRAVEQVPLPIDVLTPIGDRLWASTGHMVFIWDANTVTLIGEYLAHQPGCRVTSIAPIRMTAHHQVWSTASDGKAKLWSAETSLPAIFGSRALEGYSVSTMDAPRQEAEILRLRKLLDEANLANRDLEVAIAKLRPTAGIDLHEFEALKLQLTTERESRRVAELAALQLKEEMADRIQSAVKQALATPVPQSDGPQLSVLLRAAESRLVELEHFNSELRAKVNAVERLRAEAIDANAQLEDDLQHCHEEIRHLKDRVESQETKLVHFARQNAAEQDGAARIRDEKMQLLDTIDRLQEELSFRLSETKKAYAELDRTKQDEQETSSKLEAEIRVLESRLEGLQQDNDRLREDAAQQAAKQNHLSSELQRAEEQLDEIADMRWIRSRLSVFTEVYRIFRRVDKLERAIKGTKNHAEVEAISRQLRQFISTQCTDAELKHLGTSRYLIAPKP